ncbi:hypothetical protein ACFYTQ_16480 [Nocardia sp. NPDC004068]|uniref:hypothetical protein n=1 Tax=Nocardia sp. NPDC004068 TaxID=3364303 RepID=UPI00369AA2E0
MSRWMTPTKRALFAAIYQAAADALVALVDLDTTGLDGPGREAVGSVLMAWLRFVHTLSLEWLERGTLSRDQLRDSCIGALAGALGA